MNSVGEWAGLLGGICVLALIVTFALKAVEGFHGVSTITSLVGFRRVRFENDLSRPVVLAMCHSDHSAICEHPYDRIRIGPGRAAEEVTLPSLHTEWAVEDTSGHLLKCLILHWTAHPRSTSAVLLSSAPTWKRPCSRDTEAT